MEASQVLVGEGQGCWGYQPWQEVDMRERCDRFVDHHTQHAESVTYFPILNRPETPGFHKLHSIGLIPLPLGLLMPPLECGPDHELSDP